VNIPDAIANPLAVAWVLAIHGAWVKLLIDVRLIKQRVFGGERRRRKR
jgi:hypothetical protein